MSIGVKLKTSTMKKIILLMLGLLFYQAVLGQHLQKTIRLDKKTIPLEQLFKEIEKKGEVSFSYDPSIVELDRKVKLDGKSKPLSELLKEALAGTGLDYLEKGRLIILRKGKTDPVVKKGKLGHLLLQGTVTAAGTTETLPFTTIRLSGTSLGFVSNEEGYFKIKLPQQYSANALIFSFIGYENRKVPVSDFAQGNVSVELKESTQLLSSVEVRPIDPRELIQQAVEKVQENYHGEPVYLNAYYRELVKVDSNFVKFADAACQIYYSGYLPNSRELVREYDYYSPEQTFAFPSRLTSTRKQDHVVILEARASDNFQQVRQQYRTTDFEQFDIVSIRRRL